MPTYVYVGDGPRYYPYPPLVREFNPGDEIDLDEADEPTDGRFVRKVAPPPDPAPPKDQPSDGDPKPTTTSSKTKGA